MSVPSMRLAALMLIAASTLAYAQGHDSRGREFWVSFLENHGSGGYLEQSDLRLYAACDRPTTLRLLYHRTGVERVLRIDSANVPVEIHVDSMFGEDVEIAHGEHVSDKSILVTADDEITLYGASTRRMSSDAFLALPADVLSRRYIVLGYQNGIAGSNSSGLVDIDMPSQFAVIATEDGTLVRVTPTAPVQDYGAAPFTVGLDRGQVYFAQATLDRQWDLSGSAIQSTKPVAVFGGVRRTSIPAHIGMFRDHLIEQMPPIEVWGNEAIVTPHFDIAPVSSEDAVVRVIAATDGTQWTIDGVPQPPLMRARAVEIPLRRAMHIVADRPILVGQYEHSVNATDPVEQQFELGDPFMLLVPPSEQFDTTYAFQSIVHSEFLRHFINVIVPRDAVASVRLDGAPLDATFAPVAGTDYMYVQQELRAGSHTITADSAFGMFAYGYGRAISYGYAGGMAYRKLVHDFEPPNLSSSLACGKLDGWFFDDRITDSGIDSCYALPDSRNVVVVVEPFESAKDSVRYSAQLVDRYQDGIVSMRAIDSSGRSHSNITPVPGFTVHAALARDASPLRLDTVRSINGARSCVAFELVNYGSHEQTITALRFEPALPWITSGTTLPIRLAPGARQRVELCADVMTDTVVAVMVTVEDDCDARQVATAVIDSRIDTLGPVLHTSREACGASMVLRFADAERSSSGIASFTIDSRVNCVVEGLTPDSIVVSTTTVECRVRAIDGRRDAIVSGRIVDLAGNVSRFSDTIPGFTCAVLDAAGDTLSLEAHHDLSLETIETGAKRCDSVALVNYGTRTIAVASAHLDGNISISLPPSQFPIVVAPGARRWLVICVDGARGLELDDTLTLSDGCGRIDRVGLRGLVRAHTATGTDRCNNAISVRSIGASKRTFMMAPLPNPNGGTGASIDIGLHMDAPVSLELFDAAGLPVATILRAEPLAAGLHRVMFDVSMLKSGRYYIRLATVAGEFVETLAIVR